MPKNLFRNIRGNITTIAALSMTSTVGIAGLAAEYGNGLFGRIEDQRYADVAAMAGATNYAANNSVSAMQTAVSRATTLNGLPSADAVGTLVNSPAGDGNQSVRVVVSTSVPLMLSRLLEPHSTLPIQATAYAEIKQKTSACILALDTTASSAITDSGSGSAYAPNCDVVANSNSSTAVVISGGATMTTPCLVTVGGVSVGSGLTLNSCTTPSTNSPATSDPYASLPTPSIPTGQCKAVPTMPATLQPGYYCSGLQISSFTGSGTFASGQYYVAGNFTLAAGTHMTGTNVFFYVTHTGTTNISGSAVATLTAPTSGTYAGVIFFGDRSGTTSNSNSISGGTSTLLTGALYFPTQKLSYTGGANALSTCTQLVADKITFSGGANFGNACTGTGVKTINVPGQGYASLVQ